MEPPKNGKKPTPETIDSSIEELNKYLAKLKKERIATQKSENILFQRSKILTTEKSKAEKLLELNTKNQKNHEEIRILMQKHKNLIHDKKVKDKKNLEIQKSKNSNMKNEIDNTLRTWKTNVSSKNKKKADKAKNERDEIENEINKSKERFSDSNKGKHDRVQSEHAQKEEENKNNEYLKKLDLKKKLEETIKKEMALKSNLLEKINEHNKKNEKILEEINNYNVDIRKNSSNTRWDFLRRSFKPRSKTPRVTQSLRLNGKSKKI